MDMRKAIGSLVRRNCALLLVLSLIVGVISAEPMANSQLTSSYSSDAGANSVAFELTVYSPNQQTSYRGSMPLNFTIIWTELPTNGPFEWLYDFPVTAYYSYAIDSNPTVNILSNQSFPTNGFYALPTFSYNLDISKLPDGHHQIVILVLMYYLDNGHPSSIALNQTSSPVDFLVQSSTPQPSPTQPPTPPPTSSELQKTHALGFDLLGAIAIFVIIVVVSASLVFLKKRKPKVIFQKI